MRKEKETFRVKIMFGTAALFLSVALPFKLLTGLMPGTEIRPVNMMPPVFGLLFGAEAVWGTAIGNLLADLFVGSSPIMIVLGFITNLLYACLPHKMWYRLKLGRKEIAEPGVNTLTALLKFIFIILIDSLVTTGALALIFEMAGLKPVCRSILLLFLNNFDFAILLGIPVLCFTASRNIRPKRSRTFLPGCNVPRREMDETWPESPLSYLYASILLGAGYAAYSTYTGGAYHTKAAAVFYVLITMLCILYTIEPAGNETMRTESGMTPEKEMEKTKVEPPVALSINAKVTIGFLVLSAVSVTVTGAVAYHAMALGHVRTRLEIWNYVYGAVGIAINLIFAAAVGLLWYVERHITNPLENLAGLVRRYGSLGGSADERAKADVLLMEGCKAIRNRDEIGALAAAFEKMTEDLDRYMKNLTAVTADKERIAAELNVAARIQSSMLPCIFPPLPECERLDLYAVMLPAKEVGGDFFDFFFVGEEQFAFVIADVSGKGVPAALFMVIAKTLLKNHAQAGESPADIFTNVNRQLLEHNEEGLFVTAWMGIWDLNSDTVHYVNAGHEPPLLRRKNGTFKPLDCRPLMVLSGIEGVTYRQESLCFEPGDMLCLYTDGVTEAMNEQDHLFGRERLKLCLDRLAEETLREMVNGVKSEIDGFVGQVPQFDDITVMIVKNKGDGQCI